jgi:hypothetical protein
MTAPSAPATATARVVRAPKHDVLGAAPAPFFRALGPALSSSLRTFWLWTPAIALIASVPLVHREREPLCFHLTGGVCSTWREAFPSWTTLTPLMWLHVVLALSALAIAAFVQTAVAFERANGGTVRAALVDVWPRLMRAWVWGVVLVPMLVVTTAAVETGPLRPLFLLSPVPFYVGLAVVPALARGARHRHAERNVLGWLKWRRFFLTAVMCSALYFAAGLVVMLAYAAGMRAAENAVTVIAIVAAHVVGVCFTSVLVALARAHARS